MRVFSASSVCKDNVSIGVRTLTPTQAKLLRMEGRPAPVGGAETGIRDGVCLAGTAPGPLPAPDCPQQPSDSPPRGRTASASEAAAAAYPWVAADPLLSPWLPEIAERDEQHAQLLSNICALEGSLDAFCFAGGLQRFGLQRGLCGTWYREWAPAALAASLVGDFNGWDPRAHPCGRTADGVFEVFVPDASDGGPGMPCGSRYKVRIKLGGQGGQGGQGGGACRWWRAGPQHALGRSEALSRGSKAK